MGLSTETFNADGTSKNFSVSTTILSKSHIRVDFYYDGADHLVPASYYEVLSGIVVFDTAPTNGYVIKITVSSDGNGLDTPPTAVDNVNEYINNVITVSDNIANVNTTATNIANVNTVAGISANVTTVAGVSTSVPTVASISSDVSTVAGISSNVTTVAGISANVTTVAGNTANINTVAANDSDITIAATNIASINTVANASNLSDVITVAQDLNSLDFNNQSDVIIVANDLVLGASSSTVKVATNISDVNAVAANEADIDTVSANISNVNTVAGVSTNVTTVANDIADVNTVSTNIANVNTVATNIGTISSAATDVVESNGKLIKSTFIAYGFTKALTVEERFLETNEPNVVVDKVSEPVVFSDGLYERTANSQATLPVAPFAPTSTDELLDDKVNGLTCQMAHSKGDIVVTGNERSSNADQQTILATTSVPTIGTDIIGTELVFTIEVLSITSGVPRFYSVNCTDTSGHDLTVGTHTFIREVSADNVSAQVYFNGGGTGEYEAKVSIKLKDNIYQATVDTADMYDYAVTVGSSSPLTNGLVYRIDDAGFTGNNLGDFVRYDGATVLSSWTNGSGSLDYGTADWTFVGTASTMSLQNPYFQTLPQVTRQDVITLRKHKTTKAVDYHTFKGLNYFGEGYSQADVMSHYGYSQVDKNLWEDATYEYVFVGLESRLNSLGHHKIYNDFGWKTINGSVKQGLDTTVTSLYECATATLTDVSGRADGRVGTKVYLDNYGGLIPSSKYLAYAGKEMPRLLDSESNDLLSESWLQCGTYICQVDQTTSGDVNTLEVDNGENYNYKGLVIQLWDITQNIVIGRFTVNSVTGNTVTLNETIIGKVANPYVISGGKEKCLLTYKSSTTRDIIGAIS